ncbi:alanine racemase [Aristophania vespae]|uniref:Alanine racemase n=1 Tax=Aristophania vespae TaxID=2697033 RepID=A0A6P1NAA9_9PROT|nr:alanine racemase [Aristophania vespae]QHI95585.1 alanine racemase [Aristophania vespae]
MEYNFESNAARLTIDLSALRQNYVKLRSLAHNAECGAVLKANAYGLGIEPVAETLSGYVDSFFVALPKEGVQLKKITPKARIFVLNGFLLGQGDYLAEEGLIPVINTLSQAKEWLEICRLRKKAFPAALQFDTGMSRFGLSEQDIKQEKWLKELPLIVVMSHLACADIAEHPANEAQKKLFDELSSYFPKIPRSLSASSGIFLGQDYHYDLVRPGAALYGIAPQKGFQPFSQVVTLEAPICQIRQISKGASVGYGLTWQAQKETKLATIGIGYADGLFRYLSSKGSFWLHNKALPIIGRVSMDSVTVDIGQLETVKLEEGDYVAILGPNQNLDQLAASADTIGYEILTSLGHRFDRIYRN